MIDLLSKLPDEFFRGVGMVATFFMPTILLWAFKIAKREARLERDLDNLGAILGTEKGLDIKRRREAEELLKRGKYDGRN